MFFLANLFTTTEKTKPKPKERTTKIYNKPRLMQITKFTTMQNNPASPPPPPYHDRFTALFLGPPG